MTSHVIVLVFPKLSGWNNQEKDDVLCDTREENIPFFLILFQPDNHRNKNAYYPSIYKNSQLPFRNVINGVRNRNNFYLDNCESTVVILR